MGVGIQKECVYNYIPFHLSIYLPIHTSVCPFFPSLSTPFSQPILPFIFLILSTRQFFVDNSSTHALPNFIQGSKGMSWHKNTKVLFYENSNINKTEISLLFSQQLKDQLMGDFVILDHNGQVVTAVSEKGWAGSKATTIKGNIYTIFQREK